MCEPTLVTVGAMSSFLESAAKLGFIFAGRILTLTAVDRGGPG